MTIEGSLSAETVSLDLLRRYLTAHGWRRDQKTVVPKQETPVDQSAVIGILLDVRSGGRRNFDLYTISETGSDDVELVIPREQSASDFSRRMEGVVRTLSDWEGREPEQIVMDIRAVGFDVVRSRIPDLMVNEDTIHLAVAARYINGIKGV